MQFLNLNLFQKEVQHVLKTERLLKELFYQSVIQRINRACIVKFHRFHIGYNGMIVVTAAQRTEEPGKSVVLCIAFFSARKNDGRCINIFTRFGLIRTPYRNRKSFKFKSNPKAKFHRNPGQYAFESYQSARGNFRRP